MILFTVFVSIHFSSYAQEQFESTMREMSGRQSHTLESSFNAYIQKFNRVSGNPSVLEFIEFLDSGGVIEEHECGDGDEDNYESEECLHCLPVLINAQNALNAFIGSGNNITGIAVFKGDSIILETDSRDLGYFLQSSYKEKFSPGQFTVIAVTEDDNEDIDDDFELLYFAPIPGTSYSIICTYSGGDLAEFFKSSKPSPLGKVILVCPLRYLLDQTTQRTFQGNLDGEIGLEYTRIRPFISDNRYISGTEIFDYDLGSGDFYALFDKVGDTGWLLGVIARESDIDDSTGSSRASLATLVVFLGLAMVALSVLFVLVFTKPLVIMKDVLAKIRRGDHEVRINISQGNEYGKVAKEFNTLLDNVVIGENRHKTVVEMSDNIIFEWDFQKDEVLFSNNFGKKFSYRAPTDSYKDSFLVKCKVHPEDTANYRKTLEKLQKGESIQQDEFRWKNIFGDYVWFLLRAGPVYDKNNEILKVVGVIVDIDNAKRKEQLLSASADYDALTGLYKRQTLEELINNEIDLIAARKNEFAILFIDVDDFKFFNDNYSHATGDQVLQFTARTVRDIVENFGMAGRFGGDEFVVCIRNSETNDPAKTAEAILEKLKEGFECDVGDQLSVRVSIGIAVIRDTTKRVDEIMDLADGAMYKVKKAGKGNYGFMDLEGSK
jgi:diguanylate cyclase (GGDEF)-like protein/PAS domain S-box-containing protein